MCKNEQNSATIIKQDKLNHLYKQNYIYYLKLQM